MGRTDASFIGAAGAAIKIAALAAFMSGCATVGADIQAGRRDLLYGDPERALVYFERAAAKDPDYRYYSALPEGVLTYVGRAYYAAGRLPEARRVLEKAVSRYQDDNLAKLYLGLTLARQGDRPAGLKYLEDGLLGLHDWLDYVEQRFAFSFGKYWDPDKQIRREIENDLAMISSGKVDWPKLLASAEWVGKQMEEEIDRARRDEIDERRREGDGRRRL